MADLQVMFMCNLFFRSFDWLTVTMKCWRLFSSFLTKPCFEQNRSFCQKHNFANFQTSNPLTAPGNSIAQSEMMRPEVNICFCFILEVLTDLQLPWNVEGCFHHSWPNLVLNRIDHFASYVPLVCTISMLLI
jgi:hypothetical protein